MSSYLLLRNNKESGPFTLEEIKVMSLKAYDLIWVVGKSAAWRYPGEIPDLSAFAPPVPEQLTDLYVKKKATKQTESDGRGLENAPLEKAELPTVSRRGTTSPPSIYVNLPAEKKTPSRSKDRILFEPDLPPAINPEPAYDFSDLYKRQPTRTARLSGNVLWIATIALLFGTGILTGLFISDRRKYFTNAGKPSPNQEVLQPADKNGEQKKQELTAHTNPTTSGIDKTTLKNDSVKTSKSLASKTVTNALRKNSKTVAENKDSMAAQSALLASIKLNDSTKQSAPNKSDLLYQKIKAHPEEYVDLVTGRYSTGVFGGISSFPVSLTNNSPVKLDLVVVTVDYIQSNEKIFKTENLSFNDLEPGETVTLKAPKSTRGIKINSKIHVVNLRQLDLSSSN